MESPNLQHIPWPLVAAALSGQADAAQLDELQAWRAADLQHEQWYQKSLQIWESSQHFSFPDPFDSHQDWPKVAAQLDFQRPMLWQPYLWAASIALLFGLGLLLWLQRPQVKWQTITAGKEHQEILLTDGSKVVLREGSSLRIPDDFTASIREVQLDGEAWFEVSKDPNKGFVIEAPHLQVEVLGTVFVVRDASQDSSAEVDVMEGLVRVSAEDSLRLSAGQSVRFEAGSLQRKAQNPQFAAWRQGELRFENTSLPEVLESLERYYQVRLQSRGSPGEARLTARFTDEPLADALDVVQLIFEVEISQR